MSDELKTIGFQLITYHLSLITFLAFELFDFIDFCKSSAMTLFAREARGDEGAHDLKRQLVTDDARAQTEDVAVIMLARLVSRVCVATERSAHAAHLVRRH